MSLDFDVREYEHEGKYQAGIDRCNAILSHTPDEPNFLAKKIQLLYGKGDDEAATRILTELGNKPIKGSFTSIRRAEAYENVDLLDCAAASNRKLLNAYPRPLTNGPEMSKIWDTTIKAYTSPAAKKNALIQRFDYAIFQSRFTDAHQALIQLKALLPKSRMIYLAHAALTQMLSKSSDDIHNKLALMLARKAVTEDFDTDKDLDARVPGQIFAIQKSIPDLQKIKEKGGKIADSKQVFEALQETYPAEDGSSPDAGVSLDSLNINEEGNTLKWLTEKVEALEALYSQSIASETRSEVLLPFIVKAVQLFRKGLAINTIHHPFADACFLAVSALIQLYKQTDDKGNLYRAAFLAEVLLSYNEHVHEARYILILIYMRLGLGSLAMRYFESLRIKEVQLDTVGHTLFTDLAITHPHRFQISKKKALDPVKITEQATNMYIRHEQRLADTIAGVLQHGQTGMLFDLQDLRHKLSNSYTHRLFLLERRRLARFNNLPVDDNTVQEYPRVTAHWLDTLDTRDFKGAFNYGYDVERALHHTSDNPTNDGETTILHRLTFDHAWSILNGFGMVEDTGVLQDRFDTYHTTTASAEEKAGLPCQTANLAYQLLCLHHTNSEQPLSTHLEAFATCLDGLCRKAESLARRTADFGAVFLAESGELLRSHFRLLEAFKLVCASRARFYVRKEGDEQILETLGSAAEKSKAAFGGLQKSAVGGVKRVGEGAEGVREVVVGGAGGEGLGGELELLGEPRVAKFVKDVLASAREGWEGVGLVKG